MANLCLEIISMNQLYYGKTPFPNEQYAPMTAKVIQAQPIPGQHTTVKYFIVKFPNLPISCLNDPFTVR